MIVVVVVSVEDVDVDVLLGVTVEDGAEDVVPDTLEVVDAFD